jgi:hypothetical protein
MHVVEMVYDTFTDTAKRAVRCGSLLERVRFIQDVSYQGTRWIRGFTWFELPERNTLRLRENESCIVVFCSSVGFALMILTFAWPLLAQGHDKHNVTQGPPDRWPRGGQILTYPGAIWLV